MPARGGRWLLAGGLVAALAVAGAGCDMLRRSPAEGVELGAVAPDFELPGLDGAPRRLRALAEGRITVLTFWSERCPDCLDFFPVGVGLTRRWSDDRDRVAFVDVAYLGQPESTGSWVREAGILNPVLLDGTGEIVGRFGVSTYTVFILDRDGVIRYRGDVAGAGEALAELAAADRGA